MSNIEQLARRFIEGVLGGTDPTAFDRLVADKVWVSTGLKPDAPITSKTEYEEVLRGTLGIAFSEGTLIINELITLSKDRVLVRFTATGRHTGRLYGVAPTGRTFRMEEIHLLRFKDGQLIENYVGALNPLSYEMLFADYISSKIL